MCSRTKKEIVGVGRVSAYAEYFYEIVKLTWLRVRQYREGREGGSPVDVADYGNGGTDMDDIRFTHEDLLCFCTYFPEQGLMEQLFAKELLDTGVEVKRHWVSRHRIGKRR